MTTGYRIQSAAHDVADLLDPTKQFSLNYNGQDEDTRRGISVCDTLDDLAAYIAQSGIVIDTDASVIVHIEGTPSTDTPYDAHLGERLIHPTRIISVTDADDTGIWDLVSAAYDAIYA